jgi:hypothetical protein
MQIYIAATPVIRRQMKNDIHSSDYPRNGVGIQEITFDKLEVWQMRLKILYFPTA